MSDLDLLAAEYVLGTLDAEARARFSGRLAREPGARAAVRAWESRLPALEQEVPAADVSPQLWDRVRRAVEAGPRATVRAEEGAWITRSPGIERKTLFVDRDSGFGAYLFRIAPGAILREHGHAKLEECLILEGDVSFAQTHLVTGDFHVAFSGSVHADITSRNGAMLYVRSAIS